MRYKERITMFRVTFSLQYSPFASHSSHIIPHIFLRLRDRRECFKHISVGLTNRGECRIMWLECAGEWRILLGECDPKHHYFLFVSNYYSLHSRQWKRGIMLNLCVSTYHHVLTIGCIMLSGNSDILCDYLLMMVMSLWLHVQHIFFIW